MYVAFIIVLVLIVGCQQQETGILTVYLTDAPADLNITRLISYKSSLKDN
jgi:hypothetical protein